MKNKDILQLIEGKLIVSCQALEDEPLHSSYIMSKMALAAKLGGASGIRANSVVDICAIKKEVDLPIIGIIKKLYPDSDIHITPTMKEVRDLVECGANIIATDFTCRIRPKGNTLENFVSEIKNTFPDQLIMADISTYEEGIMAEKLGADIISTTLSGYTPYSKKLEGPDLELIRRLKESVKVPIIAEGRIHYPELVKQALECGAHAVVVGGAITRPLEITKRFVEVL